MYYLRKTRGYLFAFRPSKWVFNSLLPGPLRRKITKGLNLDTGPFNRAIDDVELIEVQRDSFLAVYYKNYGSRGVGPGVSLYVLDNEVLRFDCFGGELGHFHSMPCLAPYPQRERVEFKTSGVESQIDESAAEILQNHASHLARHFRRRIRDYSFDRDEIEKAVAKAKEHMLAEHRMNRPEESAETDTENGAIRLRTTGLAHRKDTSPI